ncbi:DUF4340 domain-containing protein [Dissulfurirhabdus thermomarina]|uniref:DUF4340 domain-containing protein n=1 Tax=Dissulfurirhabdus thermomarina TaxID=1765737 RepID=A0A6N9TTG7_DISTH|nr:DUF4340 domain-containing protein [Dissulfurirhabdus thermomarina]NDY43034.1 DUF4340 domain-containing protein [Dissulfurirhabdus thermomarina]
MGNRQLVVLAAVLAGLVAVYAWQQHRRNASPRELTAALAPADLARRADELVAWAPADPKGARLRLFKQEGRWRVDRGFPAPAKAARVEEVLEALAALRGEARAADPGLVGRFRLKSREAFHVEVRGGGERLLHLLVGKQGPDWDTCYVRAAGSDAVYLADRNVLGLFEVWQVPAKGSPDPKDWTELTVIGEGRRGVRAVAWRSAEGAWRIAPAAAPGGGGATQAKGGPAWVYTYEGPPRRRAAGARVRDFLDRLFPLQAADVEDPAKAAAFGLGAGAAELRVDLGAKGEVRLEVGRRAGEARKAWVRTADGTVYRLEGDWVPRLPAPF